MRKVRKAKLLGYDLIESQICLLYYVWAKCDDSDERSYCSLVDSGTCYARPNFLMYAINLEAEGFLENDANDATRYRLSSRGRVLIMQLGM